MPYHHVFTELNSRGELSVKPIGWVDLVIEYGYTYMGMQQNFLWRVKGTQHTFRIPLSVLNEQSKGNYEEHIEYVLENFKQDYLSWAAQGFTEQWMRDYHFEYRNLIEI